MIETHPVTLSLLLRAVRLERASRKALAQRVEEQKTRLAARTAAIRREYDSELLRGLAARGRATRLAQKLHRHKRDGYSRRSIARELAKLG